MELKHYIYLVFVMLIQVACADIQQDYILVEGKDGVFVEYFYNSCIDDNCYTENNKVYKVGNNYSFNYTHISNKGESLLFDLQFGTQNWEFCSEQNKSDTTVSVINMAVMHGREPLKKFYPDYNQTIIRYTYLNDKDTNFLQESRTGVIDNEKNIWIHPPRVGYFKILELNPFPYIQEPYEVGNTWEWSLLIGEHYGDKHWREWSGNIENTYKYEITDIVSKKTAFGEIECYEITSIGTGKFGETKLVSWFNFDYGFVKLDYTNIDSSKTIIELNSFEKLIE